MPSHVAVGTWSGGRFMRFGEPIAEERLEALLRPGDGIHTVMTADVYGEGEADRLLGRALNGVPRAEYELVGATGPGATRDSPIRGCAARTAIATTSAWPRSAAWSDSASTRSTSCSCTTPTGADSSRRRCGTLSA